MIEVLEVPPDLLHIRPWRFRRPYRHVPIPMFQYGVRSARFCPSRGKFQIRPDCSGCPLCSSTRVRHKGLSDVSGDTPHHIEFVLGVSIQSRTLINKPDGVGGHPEEVRGVPQSGGIGSKVFRVWNFASTLLSSAVGGGGVEK